MPDFTVDVECMAVLRGRLVITDAATIEGAEAQALTLAREKHRWRGIAHDGVGSVKLVRKVFIWPGKQGAPRAKEHGS